MKINGLPLPALLCDLIGSGCWRRPDDVSVLRELTNVDRPEEFAFLDPDRMARETDGARNLTSDPVQARIYGFRSSRTERQPISDRAVLDIDRAVVIALNLDEEAIFLDYRSPSDPTVVLTYYREDTGIASCREIAPSFDDFAIRIGLISAGANRQRNE